MKYVFFGTPRFAAIVLDVLIKADMSPIALVANPDRPVGRHKVITAPKTKEIALEHQDITILQPEKLDNDLVERLKKLQADFFVIAAYAKIIPKAILDIPRLGTIGVHPSLLPKYRGSSPIQSAILGGEKETGVTLYLMDDKVDHGPILATQRLPMEHPTYIALENDLALLGGKLLVDTLPEFMNGKIKPRAQDESQATFTEKFKTEDGFIDNKDLEEALMGKGEIAEKIYRKILALNPEPGTWTIKNGKRMKLLEANFYGKKLTLVTIQYEGKKPAAA